MRALSRLSHAIAGARSRTFYKYMHTYSPGETELKKSEPWLTKVLWGWGWGWLLLLLVARNSFIQPSSRQSTSAVCRCHTEEEKYDIPHRLLNLNYNVNVSTESKVIRVVAGFQAAPWLVLGFFSSSLAASLSASLMMSQIRQVDMQPAGEGINSDIEFPKGLLGEPSIGGPSVWPLKPPSWHIAVPKVRPQGSLWTHLIATASSLCDWQHILLIIFLQGVFSLVSIEILAASLFPVALITLHPSKYDGTITGTLGFICEVSRHPLYESWIFFSISYCTCNAAEKRE